MAEYNQMRFSNEFLRRYIEVAPLALAIERSMECEILAAQTFQRPILDVGCGDGVFASILCADRIDTGIDFDPAEIARAASSERYCELIACGGDGIPKPDGSYQTIFSNSVIEHIPDLMPVLKEQNRLLASGGRFYVTVPTDRWERAAWPARLFYAVKLDPLAERYAHFYNAFWRHFHAYSIPRWRALFEQAGFQVVEQKLYAPPNMTTMLDLLTPLSGPAMVSKKFLSRWIALPSVRRLMMPLLHQAVIVSTSLCRKQEGGNLAFFALTK